MKANGRRPYTYEEVEHALQAAVIASGNSRRATEMLELAGYRRVPSSTIRRWIATTHQARYRQLQEEMREEVNNRRADDFEALSRAYNEVQWETLERYREKISEMKGSELAAAVQKLAVSSGIATDKSRIYQDQPTQISKTEVDPIEALRALVVKFPGVVKVDPMLLGEARKGEQDDGEDHRS